jgi:hypothetical protein
VNYDQPRQLADKTGWHYTSRNDDRIMTIGYCRDHRDEPHSTEDEARACYARYLLEQRTMLDGTIGHYNPCQYPGGCETLTNRCVIIDGLPRWLLCDDHRTAEVVAALHGPLAGDSVHS